MNYTANYHLPQWVESDRILMEDFNEAMETIDTGLKSAQAAAETAQETKPYVVGTYTGNGAETNRDINLGFKPQFVIITAMSRTGNTANAQYLRFAFFGASGSSITVAQITNTGFRLINGSFQYPELNVKNVGYTYIAFR